MSKQKATTIRYADLVARRKRGEAMSAIAGSYGCSLSSLHRVLRAKTDITVKHRRKPAKRAGRAIKVEAANGALASGHLASAIVALRDTVGTGAVTVDLGTGELTWRPAG